MVLEPKKRQDRINKLKRDVLNYENGKAMLLDTAELAYDMATGRVVSELGYQNVEMIARKNGNEDLVNYAQEVNRYAGDTYVLEDNPYNWEWNDKGKALTDLLNQIGSLQAVDFASNTHHSNIKRIINQESVRGDQDAFTYMLGTHRNVLNESAQTLFGKNGMQRIKGYIKEIYNPHKSYEVADEKRGKELIEAGWVRYGSVADSGLAASNVKDPRLLSSEASGKTNKQTVTNGSLYVLDIGMADRQTGALMNHQQNARGTVDQSSFEFESAKREEDGSPSFYYEDRQKTARLLGDRRQKLKAKRHANLDPMTYRPSVNQDIHQQPVFSEQGTLTSFRYKASHSTRDEAMDRDNRPEAVLGQTLGSVHNKEQGDAQNRKVVEQLKDFFDADYVGNENRYLNIGPQSADPELREAYYLLPEDTKKAIESVWGTNAMTIRKDMVDQIVGYRNLTTDEVINKGMQKINKMLNKQVAGVLLTDKQANQIRKGHDFTVDIMKRYRNFIVVRNATTFLNNVKSNAAMLFNYGVPLKSLMTGHARAFQGLKDYQKTNKAKLRLQSRINAALPGTDTTDLQQQLAELQFDLNRNPVKVLIDEGMFQTILDDVDLDREANVFKNRNEQFISDVEAKLPKSVVNVSNQLLVSEDTLVHKMLSQGTQMSDFIARFVLYEELKKQQGLAADKDRKSNKKIISEVRQAFVNYNRVTDRRLQYMNDVGLVRFTKYALGVQKLILQRLKDKPTRSMAVYLADRHLDGLDSVLSSSVFLSPGNPLNPSILDAPSVIDEPIVLNTVLGLM